jgi:predicted MFS family arabinose efflux permease
MVADTAPEDLRGTAYGFFNLVSGIAMLLASVLAGLLWDRLGASTTFVAGAVFSTLALLCVLLGKQYLSSGIQAPPTLGH